MHFLAEVTLWVVQVVVREALEFSARLRIPETVGKKQVLDHLVCLLLAPFLKLLHLYQRWTRAAANDRT